MKRECEQKAVSKSVVGATKTNRIIRAFSSLAHASASVPRSVTLSANSEREEVTQAFQQEAEQKRALGIAYYRRDIAR